MEFQPMLVIPQSDFKANSAIDVTPHIKLNQNLSYLPWGVSLSMMREYNANLAVGFEENASGEPFFASERGVYLKAYVYDKTTGKRTPSLIYACRDMRRKSDAAMGIDGITNQMQRAVAKVIAQETGLGWSLYSKYDDSIAELEEQTSAPRKEYTLPTPQGAGKAAAPGRKVIAPPAADVLDF